MNGQGGSDLERSATSKQIISVATLLLWSLKNCFFNSSSYIRTALPRLRSRSCSSENLIVDAIILCLSTYSFPHFVRKLQILRIFSSSSFIPPYSLSTLYRVIYEFRIFNFLNINLFSIWILSYTTNLQNLSKFGKVHLSISFDASIAETVGGTLTNGEVI